MSKANKNRLRNIFCLLASSWLAGWHIEISIKISRDNQQELCPFIPVFLARFCLQFILQFAAGTMHERIDCDANLIFRHRQSAYLLQATRAPKAKFYRSASNGLVLLNTSVYSLISGKFSASTEAHQNSTSLIWTD